MEMIFKNSDGKYRPWFQIICIYMGTRILQNIAKVLITNSVQLDSISMLKQVVSYIIGIIFPILLYPLISKKKISSMGLTNIKKDGKDLILGLGTGILLISILVGSLTLIGNYEFVGFNISIDLIIGFIMFIGVGLCEEIMSRGALQHIIYTRYSIIWAILIPSVLFSIMHFGNPNMGSTSIINLFLVGVFFAVVTYKTGNLWMAIGIHTTWNYTMGSIFGIEVSGMKLGEGIIQMERTLDTGLNGGNFGLEGGYLCTILLCLVIFGISMMKKRDVSIENNKELEISQV